MISIITGICVAHRCKTQAFSRESTLQVSTLVTTCSQSTETPKLLKGHRRRTVEGQMGGSPKAPQQHLAGETSLLGVIRSPTTFVWAL